MAVVCFMFFTITWFSSKETNIDVLLKFTSISILVFALFNLPSLVLYLNYYAANKSTHFELNQVLNSITICKNGICKTYKLNDCKKSTYHLAYNYKNTIDKGGRESMLLSDFGYWDLEFNNGDRYYLTNLLNDFIHDTPKIRNTKYRFRLFPFIKKLDSKEGIKVNSVPKEY